MERDAKKRPTLDASDELNATTVTSYKCDNCGNMFAVDTPDGNCDVCGSHCEATTCTIVHVSNEDY